MPDGVVQWFDEAAGIGRIVHGGRRYACAAADMERDAQVVGARVHFDIGHDGEHATAVTARTGGRTGRGHGGVGNLAGAHAPWSKIGEPSTTATLELRKIDRTHPLQLARGWSDVIARGGLDDALLLYAPDAECHLDAEVLGGRRHLASALERVPVFGLEQPADELTGDDGDVIVRWAQRDDRPAWATRLRIAHGEIVAQWLGSDAEPAAVAGAAGFPIQVSTHGVVSRRTIENVVAKIEGMARLIDEPVLFARVKLSRHADPAARRPCIAEAALDVNGNMIRARVAADEMRDVVDRLEARLRDRLEHHREHRSWIRPERVPSAPGAWRHGNLPDERPSYFDRPVDEREIVRHKTWTAHESTVDEAACDLESLDFDFLLFRELASGQDSLVSRVGDGTYRLRQLEPDDVALEHTATAVSFDTRPVVDATVAEARRQLDLSREPLVFFRDRTSGRGHVLYRRYDGHYGLITPAD
jgi:hypothetical protein